MKVIKRDGREVNFEESKITNAISKANAEVDEVRRLSEAQIKAISDDIKITLNAHKHAANVEDIQDLVETGIMKMRGYEVAQRYVRYRYKHELARKNKGLYNNVLSIVRRDNESILQENSNKNPIINSTQRDYIAGELSKAISKDVLIPEDIIRAHEEGLIHLHDMDYYVQPMTNCCVFNLDDMLQNGTVISDTLIEKPKSLRTAATVISQFVAQIASQQFGGQSFTLSHLAPFVNVSRQKLRRIVRKELVAAFDSDLVTDEIVNSIAEDRLHAEIADAVQTLQYQFLTLLTSNGQAPFITEFMYINEVPEGQLREDLVLLIEETIKQRYLGIKDKTGAIVTASFPKLIYVLSENNIYEGSEYYWLTQLAAKCTAKRLVPDYVSEKVMTAVKGTTYPPMGCRSILSVDEFTEKYGNMANAKNFVPGKPKYYGRFNCGVCTISLPDVALSSKGDFDKFWELMEERTEICHRALVCRMEKLKGVPSDVAPILWQHGAIARLQPGETIDKLFYHGYSTISLGYVGLFETVKYMTGYSHTENDIGKEFGLKVMRFLNTKCNQWKEEDGYGFSLYATPEESVTYKFAKCLQKRFGIIEGITDKDYVINSYHTNIMEDITAFDKIEKEAEFQMLSPGGAITYIECGSPMDNNIPAILKVMECIYDNLVYGEINTQSNHCRKCGHDGFMDILPDKYGKLRWVCPKCGCDNQGLIVQRVRVCGYLSSNQMNQGRLADVANRVSHI